MKRSALDFSGGPDSWFDFWHTHVDYKEINGHWSARREELLKLVETFNSFKLELKKYPRDFQLWILINELDAENDSVYIHTENPNQQNFPLKVQPDERVVIENSELKNFIKSTQLRVVKTQIAGENIYYLFDISTGVRLV